nr:hypothetical protein [Tanacetum cinerariifolium]
MNQNYFEPNSNYFGFDQPSQYTIDHQPDEGMSKSDIVFEEIKMIFQQLMERLNEENQAKIKEINQLTHTFEPSRRFNSICYDDDDDYDYEESTIPLSDIISQHPPSIVITTSHPVLPTKDLGVSLIIGNEELNTIPKKESDEFINDDESLSDEDVPEDNVIIYSNPLFEFDDEYISSDVNPFFDEVLEDIECKDSYDSNLNESTFLVTPLSYSNEDEYFTPGDDVELLLHRDPSTPIMSVVSILEGFTDEPPLEENDDLSDLESKENDWKKILHDAPIDDLMSEDKIFNPEIHDQNFSLTYVSLPFED